MCRITSSVLSLCVFILSLAASLQAQLLVGTVPVGQRPNSLAVVHTVAGTRIYVANSGNHSVTVVDASTQAATSISTGVTTTSDAPQGPYSNLAANPQTGKVYLANADEGTVTVINPDNSTAIIDLGGPSAANPFAIAINPSTNTVYVADHSYRKLWIIDGNTNRVSSVAAGYGSRSVAVNSVNNRVYVANEYDDSLTIYDAAARALSTVNVGRSPWKIAVNETTNQIFVANALDSTVSVLNGSSPATVASISTGSDPVDIALDTVTGSAYVSDFQGSGLTVISPTQAASSIATGAGPLAAQWNAVNGRLYVLDKADAELAVVDPSTNDVLRVPTGADPVALAIDAQSQRAYVANQADNTLSIYDLSVQLKKTATTLFSLYRWVTSGGSVRLDATVIGQGSTPTGSVVFYDATHHVTLGAVALSPTGTASYTAQNLTDFGGYSFVAYYQGDSTSAPSRSAPLLVQLVKDSTTTSLVSQPASSVVGQTVTLISGVSTTGSHPLTGSVSFYELINDRQSLLGTVAVASGSASLQIASLNASSHTLVASYSGDTFNDSSTSLAISLNIYPGSTTATTTTLSALPNPSSAGSAVLFTATIAGTGTHAPTGMITFFDSMVSIGQVPVTNGVASLSVSTLSTGSHAITASYAGDAYNAPSGSSALTEVVNPLLSVTSTRLTSSPNPALQGTIVTLTAAVSTGGSHPPTGTIAFQDGALVLRTVSLDGSGTATYSTSLLSVGTHAITAAFAGDAYNVGSTSAVVSQVVTAPNNPVPSLSNLSPSAATAGSAGFTLSVAGANFLASSTVLWNGATRATTYIDANHLTAAIPASDIATSGSASLTVVNPAPGGGVSGAATFTINAVVPVSAPLAITALSPAVVKSGSGAFLLAVTGTFDAGATVLWGGSPRTTTAGSTALQASIQAEDVANVGMVDITIQNPGGAVSPPVKLVIDTRQGALGAFSVTSNTTNLNLSAGAIGTLPVTFTGLNSGASVQVQCVNLPANAKCSYSSGTVTLNTGGAIVAGAYPVVVVFTATQSVTPSTSGKIVSLGFIALPLCGICFSRRRRMFLTMAAFSLVVVLSFDACGGSSQNVKLPISPAEVTTTTQSSLPLNLTIR